MVTLDVTAVRSRFPALARSEGGRPVAYLDGPGGTQVAEMVVEAMAHRLRAGTSNLGGAFAASREADEVTAAAREAGADFVGGRPEEVAFGQNMTSLTFAVSRALARTWGPADEVVVTRLDHDANVTPWRLAAADRGAVLQVVDFDPADGTLDLTHLESVLGPRTRLLALTAASNALGTVPPVRWAADLAHAAGARVFVDGVHYAPHRLIDVVALGADFLACSAYKFFGPHAGLLWGRADLLESLEAYKVVPAPSMGPGKWETGTQSFESMAGVTAAVDYLAGLGEGGSRRERLAAAYAAIRRHEESLAGRFLAGVAAMPHLRLHGLADPARPAERTPTFALEVAGMSPDEAAHRLGVQGIHAWSGDYYAVGVMEHLGVAERGGLLRIGFVHYNTVEEVDRALEALAGLRAG
ncbi:MAG: cysteine desulfurase-like protein [Acidimicrobiia bacterium]|nr:cysteine desulfurase-like protein [Acidimicrobiia bacterium]